MLSEAVSIADAFFRRNGHQIDTVDLRSSGWKSSRRYSYRSFVRKNFEIQIEELSLYAKTQDPISEIWNPPAYATFRFNERVNIVSMYSLPSDDQVITPPELLRMARKLDAGAGYRFAYPVLFSPVAYINGLSFRPNQMSIGTVSRDDEIRVSNYRDHCSYGNRVHDGFLREVYELIVFNERTANRAVGTSKLQDWINSDEKRGTLMREGELFLWSLSGIDLRQLQQVLDGEHILLSGFGPDRIQ